jgi:2-polyprenyl-3-methyl-5-hydroxy-6-metoxy-1,4-benzoquinol methylase
VSDVHRRCKLCSSDQLRVLYRSRYHGFRVGCCRSCGFVFVLDMISAAMLKETYSDETAFQDFVETTDSDKVRQRNERALSDLADQLKGLNAASDLKLLDVGAGSGSFLDQARSAGFDVYGNELSDAGIAAARQKYGIELTPILLEHDARVDSFDAITMWGLLEHVADPRLILQIAFRLLRRGGVLFVYTPAWCLYDDIALTLARGSGNRWTRLLDRRISWTHLQLFSSRALQAALDDAGFEVAKIETLCEYNFKTAAHVEALHVPRLLSGVLTAGIDNMIARGWFFRNNMRVFCRKPLRP